MNTSLYKAIQCNNTNYSLENEKKLYRHLWTGLYNFYKGRLYCRTVVLDWIICSKVYLINLQLRAYWYYVLQEHGWSVFYVFSADCCYTPRIRYGNLAFSWSAAVPASLHSDLSDEIHMYSTFFHFFFVNSRKYVEFKISRLSGVNWLMSYPSSSIFVPFIGYVVWRKCWRKEIHSAHGLFPFSLGRG